MSHYAEKLSESMRPVPAGHTQHGITIVGPYSQDLDDGICLEERAHGLRLTVTVPDLSFAVPIGGPADL